MEFLKSNPALAYGLIAILFLLLVCVVVFLVKLSKANSGSNALINEAKASKIYKNKMAHKRTLEWIDVESYTEGMAKLNDGKHTLYMTGIRLEPRSITLLRMEEQSSTVQRLRLVLNKIKFPFNIACVRCKPDVTSHLESIKERIDAMNSFLDKLENAIDEAQRAGDSVEHERLSIKYERNKKILHLLEDNYNKSDFFADTMRETNFFITCTDKNDFKANRQRQELLAEFSNAGFITTPMSRADFENYFADTFENDAILEYVYSMYNEPAPTISGNDFFNLNVEG